MRTVITRADQNIARLDVKLAERLGEPVDPRVRAIAEMDPSTLPDNRRRDPHVRTAEVDLGWLRVTATVRRRPSRRRTKRSPEAR